MNHTPIVGLKKLRFDNRKCGFIVCADRRNQPERQAQRRRLTRHMDQRRRHRLVDDKALSHHVTAHAPDGFQRKSRSWKSPTTAVHQSGAPGGTRTHTVQILRLSPLPIGIQGLSHNLIMLTQKNDFAKSLSGRRFAPCATL